MKHAALATSAALLLGSAGLAHALPTVAPYVELAPCDDHVAILNHELGTDPLVFGLPGVPGVLPPSELIEAAAVPIQLSPTCSGGLVNPTIDWSVTITNLTGHSWVDLFFVADAGFLYNNFDGSILGGLAFKIDTAGINAPLVLEVGPPGTGANGIFEPLETWVFTVMDWDALAPPVFYTSPGVGGGSIDPLVPSNASIVATLVVPEPGSLALFALGLAIIGFALARRKR